jgi:tRNA(Ile)-lysidine synthetase-like protein
MTFAFHNEWRADVERLVGRGGTVVAGVSGGPDSMALMHLLAGARQDLGLTLIVAHVDHGLRPDSADDAAFVARAAAALEVPVRTATRDVMAIAAANGWSFEEAGRRTRYAFFARVAAAESGRQVAVGHTADDQAETLLLHLIRGAGIDGMVGMLDDASYPLDHAAIRHLEATWVGEGALPRLVRPLLERRRGEVLLALERAGIAYRDDPTNADPRFLRSRVRTELIPLLEQMNPRVTEALLRTASTARDDLNLLDELTSAAWHATVETRSGGAVFALPAWEVLAPAIQRRLLRRAIQRLERDGKLGLEHVEAARQFLATAQPGGQWTLPGGLLLTRSYASFEVHAVAASSPAVPNAESTDIVAADVHVAGWRLKATRRQRELGDPVRSKHPWEAVVDADAVDGLAVRRRRAGDLLAPLGMGGRHKSLQDLFVDARVPRRLRDAWPIVVSGERVVWVPGLRLDETAKVGPVTTAVFVIEADPPLEVRSAFPEL